MTTMKSMLRGSKRIKENEERSIIDETSRNRRHKKVLALLELDNHHDDPHADVEMSEKIPTFDDNVEHTNKGTKRRKHTVEYYKNKYNKKFQQLVNEDKAEAEENDEVTYMDIECEESRFPLKHFCSVCGFPGDFSCLFCESKYCSVGCHDIHSESRCLNWSA